MGRLLTKNRIVLVLHGLSQVRYGGSDGRTHSSQGGGRGPANGAVAVLEGLRKVRHGSSRFRAEPPERLGRRGTDLWIGVSEKSHEVGNRPPGSRLQLAERLRGASPDERVLVSQGPNQERNSRTDFLEAQIAELLGRLGTIFGACRLKQPDELVDLGLGWALCRR